MPGLTQLGVYNVIMFELREKFENIPLLPVISVQFILEIPNEEISNKLINKYNVGRAWYIF